MRNKSLFESAYILLLALVGLTLPTKWIQLNNVLILTMVGIFLLDKRGLEGLKNALVDRITIWLVSMYLLYAISLIYSDNLSSGFSALETRFSILVFPMILLNYYKVNKSKKDLIFGFLLTSCMVVSSICLITVWHQNHIKGISYSYVTSWMYSSDNLVAEWGFHPSYFSIYCAFCIFLVVYFVKDARLKLWVGIFIILYLVLFQMLLASRVGILSMFIVSIVTILYQTYLHRKMWLGAIASIAIFAGIIIGLYSFGTMRDKINAMLNQNVNQYNEAFKLDTRLAEWNASLLVFSDNILLGSGVGDRRDDLQVKYSDLDCRECLRRNFDSHNLILDTGVTLGIAGLLSLASILYLSIRSAFKSRNILHFQFLALFLSLSMVEATFSVQKGVVFFYFINTLFIAANKYSMHSSDTKKVP